jgi:hypothetical protein
MIRRKICSAPVASGEEESGGGLDGFDWFALRVLWLAKWAKRAHVWGLWPPADIERNESRHEQW